VCRNRSRSTLNAKVQEDSPSTEQSEEERCSGVGGWVGGWNGLLRVGLLVVTVSTALSGK